MPPFLTCPLGHRWEPGSHAGPEMPVPPLTCPICGAPMTADPPHPEGPIAADLVGTPALAGATPASVDQIPLTRASLPNAGDPSFPTRGTPLPGSAIPPGIPDELPTVPGYAVLGVLGWGGMGVVYKARQLQLNRLVALKMIRSQELANREEVARFRVEAEAVARLQHPHIVQIFEIGEWNSVPYFSLEYVEGGNLETRLAGKPLAPLEASQLMETLARAVHHAHQRGIIHRDLKPANVLLTADGTPKITDFGLAKHLEGSAGFTHTGAIMGTPKYMSPEQAAGEVKAIGPPSDVFTLGTILYQLLTGRPPFFGPSMAEALEQVRFQEPIPPTRLRRDVPRDLETICLKALAKEPANRYESALALANDLARLTAGEPILARREGAARKVTRLFGQLLSTLAFIWMVALVVCVSCAGSGARRKLDERLDSVGKNLILIRAGGRTQQGIVADSKPLKREDAAAIQKQVGPLLVGVAESAVTQRIVSTATTNHGTVLVGSTPDLEKIRNWKMAHGTFYSKEDVQRTAPVCLLGHTARKVLFPDKANPVGELVRVGQVQLRVIGVLAEKGRSPTGADQDDQVFLPITTLQRRVINDDSVALIVAAAKSEALVEKAKEDIIRLMRERHHLNTRAADDFDVSTIQEMAELAVILVYTMQMLTAIVLSLCLVLGGISIHYAMLLRISERAREIRLWRSAGASRREIIARFLRQGLLLGLVGGILGITLGIPAAVVLAAWVDWPVVIQPGVLAFALLLATGGGLLFSFYPALKASRLKPLESLASK